MREPVAPLPVLPSWAAGQIHLTGEGRQLHQARAQLVWDRAEPELTSLPLGGTRSSKVARRGKTVIERRRQPATEGLARAHLGGSARLLQAGRLPVPVPRGCHADP